MTAAMRERLEKIQEEARKTFGEEHAEKWLNSPSRYFEKRSPFEFASSEFGAQKVLKHISYFQVPTDRHFDA